MIWQPSQKAKKTKNQTDENGKRTARPFRFRICRRKLEASSELRSQQRRFGHRGVMATESFERQRPGTAASRNLFQSVSWLTSVDKCRL